MTTLSGAHVVVTGGSEGIGLAAARACAARGARVSLLARRVDRLAAAARELGGDVHTESVDVTDADAVARAVDACVAHHGPCDVLVTSAGLAEPGYFAELDLDVFRRQMDVNYFGTLHAVRAVVPAMVARRAGHVVLVSSDVGFMGVFGYSAYAPTKFAVKGLGECLRAELAPAGVHVSIVYPPDTETPGFARENEAKPEETARISASISPVPASRVGEAIARGVERNRLTITCDPQSAVLARSIGLAGPVVRWFMDRTVRQVQRTR
ncbi:MAG TPA: SDR family oxidoreductase [Acidimicrobiia bacterium]|nr:SDR family oxidoreductase [Acidimicrobiia bacterium]